MYETNDSEFYCRFLWPHSQAVFGEKKIRAANISSAALSYLKEYRKTTGRFLPREYILVGQIETGARELFLGTLWGEQIVERSIVTLYGDASPNRLLIVAQIEAERILAHSATGISSTVLAALFLAVLDWQNSQISCPPNKPAVTENSNDWIGCDIQFDM